MDILDNMDKIKCTGCEVCKNVCSKNAIAMETDEEGFWYPRTSLEKCVSCGQCRKVCPSLKKAETENEERPEVYAGWSLDEEVRFHSTSGGVFSELANIILKQGGFICGAIYNEDQMVEHYLTEKSEGLLKIRQSKYVQSRMNDIYQEIGHILKSGKSLLFCGSPCQCAGVKNYLDLKKICQEQLILVDFICRGANSPKVYRKYLDELEVAYGSKITKVWFKNKSYGWNHFSTKIEFEDGQYYLEDRKHDAYVRGYIEKNLYMRPSCTACIHKGFPRVSDITLADFWGIQLRQKDKDTDKGTSMLILNSIKAKKLFPLLKERIFFEQKTLEEAEKGNFCMYHSVPFGENRAQFMCDLEQMSFTENIRRFL